MAHACKLHSITEFRICLPLEVEEYHVGQLWSVAEASKKETGGGEGVEVIENKPFEGPMEGLDCPLMANNITYDKGQYTHKIYHISQKVPAFIRLLAPKGSLEIHEKAWNAYPYCRTIVENPDYMKHNFYIVIESFHHQDNGSLENVHGLSGRDLEKRNVVYIDIANDKVSSNDYNPDWDPLKVRSEKADRGPLPPVPDWKDTVQPVMCCYKLVKVYFKWTGFQGKVESFIMKQERRLFLNFHRQVVCWLDNYHGMTIADIRKIEEKTKADLDEQRLKGEVRGTKAE